MKNVQFFGNKSHVEFLITIQKFHLSKAGAYFLRIDRYGAEILTEKMPIFFSSFGSERWLKKQVVN